MSNSVGSNLFYVSTRGKEYRFFLKFWQHSDFQTSVSHTSSAEHVWEMITRWLNHWWLQQWQTINYGLELKWLQVPNSPAIIAAVYRWRDMVSLYTEANTKLIPVYIDFTKYCFYDNCYIAWSLNNYLFFPLEMRKLIYFKWHFLHGGVIFINRNLYVHKFIRLGIYMCVCARARTDR